MGWKRNKVTGEVVFVPDAPAAPQPWIGKPTAPLEAPRLEGQMRNTDAQTRNTQVQTQRTAQQIARDSALLNPDIRLREAQARKAEAEASKATGLDRQKLANINAAQAQIDRLRRLYKSGPGRTSGFNSVLDYLPTDANSRFDTAGAGLGEVGLAAFRVPGVGAQSDAELKAFIDANRPSSWDRDAQIEEKLNNLQNRLNQTYSAYGIKRPASGRGGWKIEPID